MLNNIRATLLRLCEMSLPMLTEFKAWAKRSSTFSDFDVDNFSSPSIRIAAAKDAQNETVAYCPLETVYMVRGYAVNPRVTPISAQRAGDILDAEIAHTAQREGVTRLLMVIPDSHPHMEEEKWIRVYERKIPQPVAMHGVGCSAPSQATQYWN